MADITNPHDKFFREVWSRQEIAVDFLANYLPEDVSKHLLLDTLEIQKDSFIEKHLKEHFSDLLYRIELKENSEAFVYMLFEHKSYPDTHVAVQLLRYMGAIWQQHLKADAGNTQLPVIIPLVFYHGTESWKPRKLSDLLASTPVNLTQYIPDFNFAFSDFAASSSPVFQGQALLQAIIRLLHAIPGGDLSKELNQIMVSLKNVTGNAEGIRLLEQIIEYMFITDNNITIDQVRRSARSELTEKVEGITMTIAEKLRKEGKQEGKQEGECTILQCLLKNRFGDIPEQYRERLEQADSETLLKWSERILTAETIEEVFEDVNR